MPFYRSWRRAALTAACGALILGGATGPAAAYSEAEELAIAKFILGFTCQDDGKAERSRAWYTEYVQIQDRAPYETNGNILLYSTAVRMIDDNRLDYNIYFGVYDPNNPVFNPRTRYKVCSDQQAFAQAMKRVVVDNKGHIKACCATEDGLNDFFTRKLKDNVDLSVRESPEDVEKVIAAIAKKAAEDDIGREYKDMDSDDKEDADKFIADFTEDFLRTLELTPAKLAEAKNNQPEKYKEKWPCNEDADGLCQVF